MIDHKYEGDFGDHMEECECPKCEHDRFFDPDSEYDSRVDREDQMYGSDADGYDYPEYWS